MSVPQVHEPAAVENHLPTLIDRARGKLAEARTAAEALEAKNVAEAALHYAKVTGAANEAHADCLRIITRCEIRISVEYRAAQSRGEVAQRKDGAAVRYHVRAPDKVVPPTLKELGLDRRRMNEFDTLAQAGEAAVDRAIAEAAAEAGGRGLKVTKTAVAKKIKRGPSKPRVNPFQPSQERQMAGDIMDFLCRVPVGKFSPHDALEITDSTLIAGIDRYFDQAIEWVDSWSDAWCQRRDEVNYIEPPSVRSTVPAKQNKPQVVRNEHDDLPNQICLLVNQGADVAAKISAERLHELCTIQHLNNLSRTLAPFTEFLVALRNEHGAHGEERKTGSPRRSGGLTGPAIRVG